MKLAPIALLVYNRPEHTRKTVEALKKNTLAIQSDLIIFSDAGKNEAQVEAVGKVRQYIHQINGFKTVTIIERKVNFGLAKSVIDGVSSIVNEYGRIIVLEDDLIVTAHFLEFMNLALDKYEIDQQVVQVSGYMFPVKVEIEEDALFLPLTTSWGWATWHRAWQRFDPNATGYVQVKSDLVLRKRFNLDGAYDYFSMLEDQLAARVDSWAIRWYLSTFLLGGLTLYPRQSLVLNVGFDGSGTHCDASGSLRGDSVNECFSPIVFPKAIVISIAWNEIRGRLQHPFNNLKILFRKLRMTFSRLCDKTIANKNA